ncbi:MAG: hypothetical protein CVU59_07285 [Deltaproteobacteria bacterium HGW-Deltaproteobacteria-17]|nr:MAG: hypothetical protein CVU59_07285 [Deltaproteobacteria bacterium HGW-Deltaproteobacteria-17]
MKESPETAELLELAAWSQLIQLTLRLSLMGLMLAAALGLSGYFFQTDAFSQFIHMGAAMGCLVPATVGINLVDRIRKKQNPPYIGALIFLGASISGLLWMFLRAEEISSMLPWPLLLAAGYASMMCGALWRLRSAARSLSRQSR